MYILSSEISAWRCHSCVCFKLPSLSLENELVWIVVLLAPGV